MLNGFLRVGPAFYPERRRGAQIIQRGPHGHRFAADPVVSRLTNQARGSGFRWWREQMNAGGDYEGFWQPEQYVEGVMGLGDAPNVASVMDCPQGAPPLPRFPIPGPRDPARAVYAELVRAVGAACRGRIGPARRFATDGVDYFLRQVPADRRPEWERHRQTALAYIQQASSGADQRLAFQEARERAFQAEMSKWNAAHAADAMARERAELEAAQGGSLSYAWNIASRDPSGAASAAATGRPPQRWTTGQQSAREAERAARDECVGIDPACWARNHWWKAALALGGIAMLYGLGSGAARRAFK